MNTNSSMVSLCPASAGNGVFLPFLSNPSGFIIVEPEAPPSDDDGWTSAWLNTSENGDCATTLQRTAEQKVLTTGVITERNHNEFQNTTKSMAVHCRKTQYEGNGKVENASKQSIVSKTSGSLCSTTHRSEQPPPQLMHDENQLKQGANCANVWSDLVADLSVCAAANYRSSVERQSQQLDEIFANVLTVTRGDSTHCPLAFSVDEHTMENEVRSNAY